jgi:divalent metal cation (Fe/Co/Zn/Cd) transporter
MSTPGSSTKVILFALIANLGIAVSKFGGAYFTTSSAMLSEAIHSLVDSTNQVLLLIGNKRAARPPTETHPLGFGAESFFWSFIVAILLFSMGGMFAIYEGFHKLTSESEVHSPYISIGILIVSLIFESLSFKACLSEVKAENPYSSYWEWFRKSTSSELLVVFTEDLAALLGLTIATVCVFITWITGNSLWDAIGSILIGFLLVTVAAFLSIEIKSLLVGEAPARDFKPFIQERLSTILPEAQLLRIIAIQTGGNQVLLSYKISPGRTTDVKKLIEGINQLERDVKSEFKEVAWQFVEPDYQA